MNPNLYKQVKKMNKCLKEINSMGYVVFLKDGPHHQLMKVEKKFKKNKQKKEKKPKHESFAIFVNEFASSHSYLKLPNFILQLVCLYFFSVVFC